MIVLNISSFKDYQKQSLVWQKEQTFDYAKNEKKNYK